MDIHLCGVVHGEIPHLSEVTGDSCSLASLALHRQQDLDLKGAFCAKLCLCRLG